MYFMNNKTKSLTKTAKLAASDVINTDLGFYFMFGEKDPKLSQGKKFRGINSVNITKYSTYDTRD